jgi:hypothetical protein
MIFFNPILNAKRILYILKPKGHSSEKTEEIKPIKSNYLDVEAVQQWYSERRRR